MQNIIKIPLYQEQKQTLEDYFEDKPSESLHKFFYEILRKLSANAKDTFAGRLVSVNVLNEGKLGPIDIPLKGLELDKYALASDPNWLPKDMDSEYKAYFELKIGDKFHNYLLEYCKLYELRIDKFNESIPMIKDPKAPKDTEAKLIKDPQFRNLPHCTCLEDVINRAILAPLAEILDKAIKEMFDKENEIIEKSMN